MHHFNIVPLGFFVASLAGCGSDSKATSKACKTATDCGFSNVCVNSKCVALPGNGGADSGLVTGSGGSSFGGFPPNGTGGDLIGPGGGTSSGGTGPAGSGGSTNGDSGPPPRGDAGPIVVPGSPGSVPCGDTSCMNRDSCCGTTAAGGTQYACSPSACSGAGVVISCDGPEDCAAAQSCCQSRGGGGPIGGGTYSYSCQARCTGATIGCGGPANCGAGQVCCTAVTAGGASKTSCEDRACAQGEYQICRVNRDCAVGMTCTPSLAPYLPGLRYCM